MTGSATVTAKTGPAQQVTALAISNVLNILFDIERDDIAVTGGSPPKTQHFDFSDISAVTFTVSEGVSIAVTITNA